MKRKTWKICLGQERRGVFPPAARVQATALACSLPKTKGRALSRWSLAEIESSLVQLGIVTEISTSTLCRWFASEKIKPWRYHSWQHILDPKVFMERARPILQAYGEAKALLEQGTWLVSLDEKTSIQARQRPQETEPANSGNPAHVSSRYKRKGALHLFAALSFPFAHFYGGFGDSAAS